MAAMTCSPCNLICRFLPLISTRQWELPLKKMSNNKLQKKGNNPAAGQQNQKAAAVFHASATEIYQGPLPPPTVLKAFQEINPELPNIIIETYIKQVNHRIEMEKISVPHREKLAERGLWCAFFIAVFGITAAVICAFKNQPAIGSVIAGTSLVSVTVAFLRHSMGKK